MLPNERAHKITIENMFEKHPFIDGISVNF